MTKELKQLKAEWKSLATAKWREFRHAQGHFISRHNPRWTMDVDLERRMKASELLMDYCQQWFKERGVEVVCEMDEKEHAAFDIYLKDDYDEHN